MVIDWAIFYGFVLTWTCLSLVTLYASIPLGLSELKSTLYDLWKFVYFQLRESGHSNALWHYFSKDQSEIYWTLLSYVYQIFITSWQATLRPLHYCIFLFSLNIKCRTRRNPVSKMNYILHCRLMDKGVRAIRKADVCDNRAVTRAVWLRSVLVAT